MSWEEQANGYAAWSSSAEESVQVAASGLIDIDVRHFNRVYGAHHFDRTGIFDKK
jgi:hypothetical protein